MRSSSDTFKLSKKMALLIVLGGLAALILVPATSWSSVNNRLYRVEIKPRKEYTRINVKLENPPRYTLTKLPGNRLRLTLLDTTGPFFKKFRRYSDANIGGLEFKRRGSSMMMTFQIASSGGWRDLNINGVSVVSVDVGSSLRPPPLHSFIPGRDRIWSGVEKLVHDFDPPLKPEIPFQPTDRQILKSILDENDQQLFMAAEGLLYKGQLSEAEELLVPFAARQTAVKSLALYRLGETYYKLQKYPQALASFREAERLWPAFLGFDAGVTFYYGDSIARNGDLAQARLLLTGLIARLADKKFAPTLLVRLADILARQGYGPESLAMYRTVSENFESNKAHRMALLRLADREFFKVTPWSYRRLSDEYLTIAKQSGEIDLREESLFKNALLESLYGPAPEALQQVVVFQKKFPRGSYASVSRTMREVLVAETYRRTNLAKDALGLIRFAEEHQDYLAGCILQPDFLRNVTKAYEEAGRPLELIKLFSTLVDRQWATGSEPYLYSQIADNAELLGDSALAIKTRRAFLRRYPGDSQARFMLERLGGLYYGDGKLQDAKGALMWLLNSGERAQFAESYYYLGLALWKEKNITQTAKAMDLFIASAKQGGSEVKLLPDAYFTAASARDASGDRKAALQLLENGLKLPGNNRRDQFLYRLGELSLLDGKRQVARDYFEKVAKGGKDPDWQRMAAKSLESIEITSRSGKIK